MGWLRSTRAKPPFVGYLEEPSSTASPGMGLRIAGWVFHRDADIVRLYVHDGEREIALSRDLPRPDVESRFPSEPRARSCGFHGSMPLDRTANALEIGAELANGERRPVFAIPLRRSSSLWATVRARFEGESGRRSFEELLRRVATDRFPRVADAAAEVSRELRRAPEGTALTVLARPVDSPAHTGATRDSQGARLLFVSAMFPSTAHAGGLRLFDLIQHLAPRHPIDLIAPFREGLDGPCWAALRPHLDAVERLSSTEMRPGEVVDWLHRLGRRPGEYQAVHFDYPESAIVIEAVAPFARKSFYTMMECLTLSGLIDLDNALAHSGDLAGAAARFLRSFTVERKALARVDVPIAVTDVDAEFVRRCFGAHAVVLPTCVSEHEIFARLAPDNDDPASRTALFIGYFDHYPNQDAVAWYLKEVHPLVAERLPDYRFRVVGRGDLSAIRARWGADPRVEIVGAVDNLAQEMQRARIGVAPMVSGAGIRGKINQLAAAGRPTVATPLAALGLPYRDDESIVIAERPDEFAQAIVRLLTDDALWRRMRRESRALVEQHFRWPAVIAKLESLHES